MLSLKGDTKGQKDQIVNELLKVHQRFQARIAEYKVLLNMTIAFFKNLEQVNVYSTLFLPSQILLEGEFCKKNPEKLPILTHCRSKSS